MKKVILITIVLALLFAFVGCAKTDTTDDATTEDTTQDTAADDTAADDTAADDTAADDTATDDTAEAVELTFAGSTSVGPAIEALADMYMEANPNIEITVEAGGSGVGVTSAGEGSVDMGMASRDVKEEELAQFPDMVSTVLCLDGVAVVVNAENTVEDLTAEQITKIFMGEITDWSDVGGEAGAINLYTRDSASGTREAFEKAFDVEIDETLYKGAFDSNGALATAVEGDAGGVGYMSLGIVANYSTLKSLKVGGVDATSENVINGSYPFFRNFNLLTLGAPAGAVADFIDYCMTDEAKAYLEEKGYINK
jgi:phosphate transport system substrate-binding protein